MQALWDKLERDAVAPTKERRKPDRVRMPARARPVDNCALAALAGGALAVRFRHWRGASGRRYVFSVYDPASCPAYDDALLAVVAHGGGARRIISIFDTGALPELALGRAREAGAALGGSVECHVHLLAASRAERTAVIEDLRPIAEGRRE